MSESQPSNLPPPIDFTYRYQPGNPKPMYAPGDWESASVFLQAGNALTVRFYNACRRGFFNEESSPPIIEISEAEAHSEPKGPDGLPIQMPFALMLGCSDARVPTELLFGQEFNDIFNIRVAGNVLADEGIGSLIYALRTFVPETRQAGTRSMKLVGVLGHRGCGAVRATVTTFQSGPLAARVFADPLGSIVSKIAAPAMSLAAELYDEMFGEGASADRANIDNLVELTVYLNAAWSAHQALHWVEREGPEISSKVGVVYGVFDPLTWRVNSLPETPHDPVPECLAQPPRSIEELRALGVTVLTRLSHSIVDGGIRARDGGPE